ncbi:TDR15 protein, partial [Rhinopomastus cyanomelas]|nr:TDR15 protein [Rhinopomastus cyanomelas]
WHRGRVLENRENIYEVIIIDTGQVLVVEETRLASACDELFQLPPKVVLGIFANVLPLKDKWDSKAVNYFQSLVGLQIIGHVRTVLPYQVFILEVPKIISDVLELQLGRCIDGDSFCLIVETLRAFPQEMLYKRVPQLLQKNYPVKELRALGNCEEPTDFWPVPDFLFRHLSVGSKENVKITAAVGPNKFYCQIEKWQKNVEDLTKAMHLCYEAVSRKNRNSDSFGLLCAAKRQNGQWHRGVIKQILFGHVEVWFMDFGNIEAVPSPCIQKLKEQFTALPMVSFPCALSCLDSEDEAVIKTQLKKLIWSLIGQTSVCVHIDSFDDVKRLYYVTLQSKDLGIITEHPESLNEAAASCISLLKTNITNIAADYEQCRYRCNSRTDCTENKPTKALLPQQDISLLSHCKRAEMQIGSYCPAFVVHVLNPSDFWIQTCNYQDQFEALMKNIADRYSHCGADEMLLKDPKRGLLCCARYSQDMHYYRGVITEVLDANVTVCFLDFGNTERVPYYDVKILLPEFSRLPALAVSCKLAWASPGDGVWCKKQVDFFKEIVFDKLVILHVTGKQNNTCVVNVYFQDGLKQGHVAKCMAQAGYAEYMEVTPDSAVNSAKKSRYLTCHKRSKKKRNARNICKNREKFNEENLRGLPFVRRGCVMLSCFGKGEFSKRCISVCEKKKLYKESTFTVGAVLEVVCTCIVSPADFSCQLQSKLSELNNLMEQIQAYYREHTSPYNTGQPACVVKCTEDGKWYRATVMQQVSTDEVDVVFVDYGYRKRVLLKDLQDVHPDFLTLESQAIQCRLKNVPLQIESLDWSEVCRHFEDIISTSGGPLTCIICAVVVVSSNHLCNIVDLETPSVSAEKFLRECGLTQLEFSGLRNLTSLGSLCSFCYSSFNINIGSEEEVYITHIRSPSEFYCQLNRNTETVEALMEMVTVLSKMSDNVKYDSSSSRLCIARYFGDGLFYRALALPVESTSYVCAEFVDFGNKSMVEEDQVIPIPDSATDLIFTPVQAIKCCMSDFRDTKISTRITKWFEQTFLGKLLKAVIISRESDGRIAVELRDGPLSVSWKIKEKILEELPLESTKQSYDKNYPTDTGQNFGDEEETAYSTQELCSGFSKPLALQDSEELGFRSIVRALLEHKEEPLLGEPASHSLCHPALDSKEVTAHSFSESHNERLNYTGQQERSNENRPKLISLPQRDIQVNSEVTGYISHINSPSSFYVQLAEDENLIIQLANEINESTVNTGYENGLNELVVGDLIAAEHITDGFYYRAVIKTLKSGNHFEIEFIDYGNTAVVSPSKICRVERKFLALPRLSVHCCLSRVKSVADESCTNIIISYFESKTNNKLICKFLQQHGDQWEVDIIYILMGEVLLQEYLNRLANHCLFTVEAEKSDSTDCNEFATSFKINSDMGMWLQSGRRFYGVATAVTDPSNFCIRFEKLDGWLQNLSLLLCGLPDDLPALPKELVACGATCLIKSELEAQWNRVEISRVTSQSVVLTFIDYGFQNSIPYSDIHKLKVSPEPLCVLPRLVHSCSLHSI